MGEIGEGGIEWQKKTKQWMKIVCSHIRKGKKKFFQTRSVLRWNFSQFCMYNKC